MDIQHQLQETHRKEGSVMTGKCEACGGNIRSGSQTVLYFFSTILVSNRLNLLEEWIFICTRML
jgi:hypothetical protein